MGQHCFELSQISGQCHSDTTWVSLFLFRSLIWVCFTSGARFLAAAADFVASAVIETTLARPHVGTCHLEPCNQGMDKNVVAG